MAFNTGVLFAVAVLISTISADSSAISGSSATPTAGTSGTASGTSTTASTVPSSSTIVDIDLGEQIFVPFSGFGEDNSVAWGILVQNQSDTTDTAGSSDSFLYEIIVNNSTSPQAPGFIGSCVGDPYQPLNVLIDADDLTPLTDGEVPVTILMEPSNNGTLILGHNSTLEHRGGGQVVSPNCDIVDAIDTVPFAINLGRHGYWNGSVVWGTYYDANRIGSTSWHMVSESVKGSSTFLQYGYQLAAIKIADSGNSLNINAFLDINDDKLTLPQTFSCDGGNITVTFAGATAAQDLIIVIQEDLFSSADRCTHGASPLVTLGRPFFQAAYTYVCFSVEGVVMSSIE